MQAVSDVSFRIESAETLGVVGESGCGKTTVGRAVMRLVRPSAGRVVFDGQEVTRLGSRQLRKVRKEFQMVFQDPYGSLDPRMTVEEIIGEALDIHQLAASREERRRTIVEGLQSVGLDASHAWRYPHEFSGGQRQRIGIARALAVRPRLMVCDEPVSALDVSVQAQVINLFQDLQSERKIAYLFIGHDLAVVEHISHRIMVMYLGQVMEMAPAKMICQSPLHPYTQSLVSAVPSVSKNVRAKRTRLSGEVPSPIHPPKGCPFHPRCPIAMERCGMEKPLLREVVAGHWVACHAV